MKKRVEGPAPSAAGSPPLTPALAEAKGGGPESITFRPLSEIRTWEGNYNQGDVGAISASIRRFGFNSGLRVWGETVVAGNHSLLSLRSMHGRGEPAPAGIVVRGSDWLCACISVDHLTWAEAEAFAVADNRLPQLARADDRKLAELLANARSLGALDATGYREDDLLAMLKRASGLAQPVSQGSGSTTAMPMLKWGRHQAPLTAEEGEALTLRLDLWVAEAGTAFGFVRSLLDLE